MSKVERKKQAGNSVCLSTTVTPFQYALVQGLAVTGSTQVTGTRVARGHLATFIGELIDSYFSGKYKMPMFLLEEIMTEAGVLEEVEDENGERVKNKKLYPLAVDTVDNVVEAYRKSLVNFLYEGRPEEVTE